MTDPYGPISGQLIGTMKEACKETFLGGNPRIVQGMYKCTIYSPMEYYGNVCDVLKRRRGNIIDNDYQDLTSLYIIIAELPVVESFGFYNEVMRLTSGRVTPHIEFDSWQVLEIDPFYVSTTKEEIEEDGDEGLMKNPAKLLIEKVRKRKGMALDKVLVVNGDKQSNIGKAS